LERVALVEIDRLAQIKEAVGVEALRELVALIVEIALNLEIDAKAPRAPLLGIVRV